MARSPAELSIPAFVAIAHQAGHSLSPDRIAAPAFFPPSIIGRSSQSPLRRLRQRGGRAVPFDTHYWRCAALPTAPSRHSPHS